MRKAGCWVEISCPATGFALALCLRQQKAMVDHYRKPAEISIETIVAATGARSKGIHGRVPFGGNTRPGIGRFSGPKACSTPRCIVTQPWDSRATTFGSMQGRTRLQEHTRHPSRLKGTSGGAAKTHARVGASGSKGKKTWGIGSHIPNKPTEQGCHPIEVCPINKQPFGASSVLSFRAGGASNAESHP